MRGARSHPGGPPETKEDSAHPALYEHSHGWAGGNIRDASHDETGDRGNPEEAMATGGRFDLGTGPP
ncbi:protein of unknown function [Streptantibioticus cattleyicolor NRRL 8057 = DSM 46488]|nr:protein of unknown function [Streptantibioticus cattleyicolor NRRL 8057 = DSM 46488]